MLVCPVATAAPTLQQVRSYLYLVFSQTNSPGIYENIRAAPHDMVILGVQANDPPLDRAQADPAGSKLIVGYTSLTLGSTWGTPNLFGPGGVPPVWFGNQDPDWPGTYSVQYWNPAWLEDLKAHVDKLIAEGYDGVFLDTANGDIGWQPGNRHGNPVFPNASHDLGTLLLNLKAYIQTKALAKPFYMIPNGPLGVAQAYPEALAAVDGIFSENLYFMANGVDGMVTKETPPGTDAWLQSTAVPAYGALGVPIFGNDYPEPTTDSALSLRTFLTYVKFGWIPSVVDGQSMVQTIATGPHMYTAVSGNPTVTGTRSLVNYISGGKTNAAVLTGGDQGDYFVGGPGSNTIIGGAGDDTIYPHPQRAVLQQSMKLTLAATIVGNRPTPKISVIVNGSILVPPTAVTAIQPASQDLSFELPRGTTISSFVLRVSDAEYIDAQNYSNMQFKLFTYKDVAVDLTSAVLTGGDNTQGYTYSGTGTVTFPPSALHAAPAYPAGNSSTVDGGGGTNTAIYFGRYSNYTVTAQPDGALFVTASATAEGPDTLRNIQRLKFWDDCMFEWLERTYSQYLSPAGSVSATAPGLPYYYRYYTGTGTYVATSSADGALWLLGAPTGGALLNVGAAMHYAAAAGCNP